MSSSSYAEVAAQSPGFTCPGNTLGKVFAKNTFQPFGLFGAFEHWNEIRR